MNDHVQKQDPISGAQNIKEGSMQDKTLLRIGAVSLIVGIVVFVLSVFAGLLQLAEGEPGDFRPLLQSIADSPLWGGIHVVGLAALLLFIGGLLALSRSITKEPGSALAQLGFTSALLGGVFLSIQSIMEGSHTMKALTEAWAAATDKEVLFTVAKTLFNLGTDFGSWGVVIIFGVVPIIFGLAIVLTDIYPKWLGWMALVGGVGAASMGIALFLQGLFHAGIFSFFVFAVVVTLWLIVMGVLMWRRAGAAANP